MTTNYLLPCSCGKTVAVRDSPARPRCQCGAELECPPGNGSTNLNRPLSRAPAATRPGWNPAWELFCSAFS